MGTNNRIVDSLRYVTAEELLDLPDEVVSSEELLELFHVLEAGLADLREGPGWVSLNKSLMTLENE